MLDEAIAANRRDATSTNDKPATILQRETEFKKLEARLAEEANKTRCAQYAAYLRYAVSAYQDRFSAPIANCGGTIEPFPPLPTPDWWASTMARVGGGGDKKTDTISTNCGVRFEYSFWARRFPGVPTTIILAQGKKSKKARVEFILRSDYSFLSRLHLDGDDPFISKAHDLEDKTNCIKDVDYVLDLFFESQKEEFQ